LPSKLIRQTKTKFVMDRRGGDRREPDGLGQQVFEINGAFLARFQRVNTANDITLTV